MNSSSGQPVAAASPDVEMVGYGWSYVGLQKDGELLQIPAMEECARIGATLKPYDARQQQK